MQIKREHRQTAVGSIELITLLSHHLKIVLTSYGAGWYQAEMDDHELLVGPQDLDDYLQSTSYYGKTIGRVSGRLVVPFYEIDGIKYPVKPVGSEKTNLHGGKVGFSFRNFEIVEERVHADSVSVTMKYVSKDNEEDFPGELTLFVKYTLNDKDELRIDYDAKSNRDTLCNITCHPYFNFQKEKKNIFKHELTVKANDYLNIDEDYMIQSKDSVEHTPFDLRKPAVLGERIKAMGTTPFQGFDHTWIFSQKENQVTLYDPESNIGMQVDSSYPAMVIYTHNIPSAKVLEQTGNLGIHSSVALECQFEPGGIHHHFLNHAILRKNEHYQHHITYRFFRKER